MTLARIPIPFAIDEARKSHAQGFERKGRRDKTHILMVLPTTPKIMMKIA
ncbi:unnamed protein product, partial [Rotaria sordida]